MRVVVIGAGLGGLECGYILAKNGCKVTILEQSPQIGGCIQSYKRKGERFDTGFHCVGGLDKGEHLWRLFDYLNLNGLPWKPMDRDGFDRIVVGDEEYAIPVGHQAFAERLKYYFPKEKEHIDQYVALLKKVGDTIGSDADLREKLLSASAYDYLHELFDDPTLIQVVSGASMKLDLSAERLPLYSFLQINDSYLRGAYRLAGGGETLTQHLADGIVAMGGEIITSACVKQLHSNENSIDAVEVLLKNDDTFRIENPDFVISSVNPSVTFSMLAGDFKLRPIYQRRIAKMPSSIGIFTASLVMKEGSFSYRNHNIYIHPEGDLWQRDGERVEDVMIHFAVPENADAPCKIDLMAPMKWDIVSSSGENYKHIKQQWLDEAVSIANGQLPSLRDNIAEAYTSTPLTYHRYTGVEKGAAFGVERDWHNGIDSVISARTPIRNLLLTGQNLMLHGVLGVTMTAFDTVSHIMKIDIP